MGINISLRKVINKSTEETLSYYETEKLLWFDSLRYGGDKEFINENEFFFIDNDRELRRPVDFTKCRKWVNNNIYR